MTHFTVFTGFGFAVEVQVGVGRIEVAIEALIAHRVNADQINHLTRAMWRGISNGERTDCADMVFKL